MAQQRQLVIADHRAVTPRLRWLTLHAPDLARGAVTLIAGADDPERLPPPFLLPGAVEYQTVPGLQIADFKLQIAGSGTQSAIYNLQSAITWADQIFAALPSEQLLALRDAIG